MKKIQILAFASAFALGGMLISCDKSQEENLEPTPVQQISKGSESVDALTQYGERVSMAGNIVHGDFYHKFAGFGDPITGGSPGYEDCWTGEMDCTCLGGICGIAGFASLGSLNGDPSYDPGAVSNAVGYLWNGDLVFGFSVDPSIHNPAINANPIVPISTNFFLDPAMAATLGYSSIEVIAGNYVIDYSYNANGEIIPNVILTP